MVVLTPAYPGEETRSCTGCTHVGLASPIKERSSFPFWKSRGYYSRRCRGCVRQRWRRGTKAYKGRMLKMHGVEAVRQDARIDRTRGRALKKVGESGYQYTGVLLPPGPFQKWVEGLVVKERAQGFVIDAFPRVARNLGLDESYLGKVLKRKKPIDESVVDLAVSRHGGVTIRDLYESYDGPKAVEERVEMPEEEPAVCGDPACGLLAGWSVNVKKKQVLGVIENGGRFCEGHAFRLAEIRADLENDSALMSTNGGAPKSSSRRRLASQPTCTNPHCWQPRTGPAFCDECVAAGYREEEDLVRFAS